MPAKTKPAARKAPAKRTTSKRTPGKATAKPAVSAETKRQARGAAATRTRSAKAESNGKGYDPSIPLEQRSQAEQEATADAFAKASLREQVEQEKRSREARKADRGKAASGKSGSKGNGKPKGESLKDRILAVLRESDGPLHVKELVERMEAKYGKGKVFSNAPTPPTTRTFVQCDNAAKKDILVRTDRATFDLKELNPRGSKARPKPRASRSSKK